MNETSLSLLAQLGDCSEDQAWDRLVRIYGPLLRSWLHKYDLQPNDADDLVQEVLLAVSKDVQSFDHNGRPGAFRAWVKSILVNRLRNYWRTRDRRPNASGGSSVDDRLNQLDDPASAMTLLWNREHDQHVLRELLSIVRPQFAEDTWKAFTRVALEGAKANVVAEELGLSLNAVFIAKSRVLSRLRQEADGLVESSSSFSPGN